jgi:hypothetical protein
MIQESLFFLMNGQRMLSSIVNITRGNICDINCNCSVEGCARSTEELDERSPPRINGGDYLSEDFFIYF